MIPPNPSLPHIPLLHHLPPFPPKHRARPHIIRQIILRRILHHSLPERDIDPPLRLGALRDTVLPLVLRLAAHDDHIPIVQVELLDGEAVSLVLGMAEEEVARGAEGDGGYAGVGAEEALRVGMVGYRVGSGGIVVDE